MTERLPDWLAPAQPVVTSTEPDWLTAVPDPPKLSKAGKSLLQTQFEMVFPRILDSIHAGSTLANAVRELPIEIDVGAFTTWLYKDSRRKSLYQEAKEVRAESWTGDMIKHALGEDVTCDIDRSKFVVDTYKWLIARQARKEYGDTKTIEMNTTISITAALAQANERVINATIVDDEDTDLLDPSEYKRLASPPSLETEDDTP